ncbi:MAG: epoxyqueuosine reductase QueH [Candidatus Omnitrophica bacterium]|nr:epoxyqueuosine reductase QueH [Candidatus Omnitrophota bacterium]
MRILLHICCGPCLIYPLKQLRAKGFTVEGFFYNPNIHPPAEYSRRKEALQYLIKTLDTPMSYPEYKPLDFFSAIKSNKNKPQRCSVCWYLRLKRTAKEAKDRGFNFFSSTLLVSPYQDQEILKGIGRAVSEEERINFYYEDFRVGFRAAHAQAKAMGIYCQNYCGCIYSKQERCKKLQRH